MLDVLERERQWEVVSSDPILLRCRWPSSKLSPFFIVCFYVIPNAFSHWNVVINSEENKIYRDWRIRKFHGDWDQREWAKLWKCSIYRGMMMSGIMWCAEKWRPRTETKSPKSRKSKDWSLRLLFRGENRSRENWRTEGLHRIRRERSTLKDWPQERRDWGRKKSKLRMRWKRATKNQKEREREKEREGTDVIEKELWHGHGDCLKYRCAADHISWGHVASLCNSLSCSNSNSSSMTWTRYEMCLRDF